MSALVRSEGTPLDAVDRESTNEAGL